MPAGSNNLGLPHSSLPDIANVEVHLTSPVPVSIVTGFLGSGKTTLIRDCLSCRHLADSAVIINEFGEIGLDHLLVEQADEHTLLLANGCLCCTWQSSLADTLLSLLERRERQEIPHFKHVFIETSGLADPVPILQTLLSDPLRLSAFAAAKVITVLDATIPIELIQKNEPAQRQLALADLIVVSKEESASPSHPIIIDDIRQGLFADCVMRSDLQLRVETFFGEHHRRTLPINTIGDHRNEVTTWSQYLDQPIHWPTLMSWFNDLSARFNERLLRVKGLVEIVGEPRPVVVQAVRHVLARPVHLPQWPNDSHRGRLVVITQGASGDSDLSLPIDPPSPAPARTPAH